MPEKKEVVSPVKVSMICECGGEMKPTGITYTSNPPIFPHICERCGKGDSFREMYPRIVYEVLTNQTGR